MAKGQRAKWGQGLSGGDRLGGRRAEGVIGGRGPSWGWGGVGAGSLGPRRGLRPPFPTQDPDGSPANAAFAGCSAAFVGCDAAMEGCGAAFEGCDAVMEGDGAAFEGCVGALEGCDGPSAGADAAAGEPWARPTPPPRPPPAGIVHEVRRATISWRGAMACAAGAAGGKPPTGGGAGAREWCAGGRREAVRDGIAGGGGSSGPLYNSSSPRRPKRARLAETSVRTARTSPRRFRRGDVGLSGGARQFREVGRGRRWERVALPRHRGEGLIHATRLRGARF